MDVKENFINAKLIIFRLMKYDIVVTKIHSKS